VAAAVEEANAQVEEITASAQSLSEMAQTLQALVAQFTLPEAQGGGETHRQGDKVRRPVDRAHVSTSPVPHVSAHAMPGGDGRQNQLQKPVGRGT
jgi:hypothetical protein